MATVVVSGSDARTDAVVEALRAAGAEVVAVRDLAGLRDAVAGMAPGSLGHYVQMPVSVEGAGETVVGRVRRFLADGLLARFEAADVVLPALADDARVVLVAGNTPVSGGDQPDDRAARQALMGVLAHALRADKAPARLRVSTVDHDRAPDDIAEVALSGERRSREVADLQSREADMSYEDWRTEVMGLARIAI